MQAADRSNFTDGPSHGYLDGSMIIDVLRMLVLRVVWVILDRGVDNARDARP